MENYEQFEAWFEKYDVFKPKITLGDLEIKLHPCKQVGAIMFLANKLKDKNEDYFLHGEHDILYIGSSFDIFEDFTEEDVKIAVANNQIQFGLAASENDEDSILISENLY